MAVKAVKQTEEEKLAEREKFAGKKGAVEDDILSSLDLPKTKEELEAGGGDEVPSGEEGEIGVDDSVSFPGENEETLKGKVVKIDEDKNEVTVEDGEGQKYVLSSEDLTPLKKAAKKESDEGDLIPKSKHDKIIKKLTTRVNTLTRDAKIAKATKTGDDTRDPDTVKLEAKSPAELKTLKREVRLRQAKLAREEENDETNTKLNQLVDLELKIDNVISSTPQRFLDKQLAVYNDKAAEIYEDPDIEDVEAAAPLIKKIAQQIFSDYPKLQAVEDGQALALGLAVDHYKALQKDVSSKSEVKDLRRKANRMKRRTALDTGKVKGSLGRARIDALRKKAFHGTHADKEALVFADPRFNIDALIPDEYKE